MTVTSITHDLVPASAQANDATITAVSAGDADREPGVADLDWSVSMAVRVLRMAKPAGSVFLRALVDEGGTATAARLRELTGATQLNPMTQTLNNAMKTVFGVRRLAYDDRHLAHPHRDPENPRRVAVHSYSLPRHIVPILGEALRQLDR